MPYFDNHSIIDIILSDARSAPLRRSGLRFVRANDVTNDGPAQRTVAAADAAPLLDGALVAHAHVTAHVQHRVDRMLVADGALGAGGQIGAGRRSGGGGVLPLAERGKVLRDDGLQREFRVSFVFNGSTLDV